MIENILFAFLNLGVLVVFIVALLFILYILFKGGGDRDD